MTTMRTPSTPRTLLIVLTALAALAVTLSACGGDDHADDHADGEGVSTGNSCPPGRPLTYETFGEPFMEQYCVRCHSSELEGADRSGAPEGHDFDSIGGILLVADHVDQYAAAGPDATNTVMPPTDPKPSTQERELLGEWLACELK